jgi:uncharacterized protein
MRFEIMKSGLLFALLTSFVFTLAQEKDPVKEIEDHRAKQEAEFRDEKSSPLTKKDRKKFKHLNYYPIDLSYRVEARFIRTANMPLFKMKTTTTRLPEYTKYGEVHFELNGLPLKLEVYQSPEISARPGYEDYLFIPFTDLTNGDDTYEVGRYLELRIPNDDAIVLDFNKAYNPYCSYNPGYSCPIPPEPNHLQVAIPVGEKKYKLNHR